MSGTPKHTTAHWLEQARQEQLREIEAAQARQRAELERQQRAAREAAERASLEQAVAAVLARLDALAKHQDAASQKVAVAQTRATLLALQRQVGPQGQSTTLRTELRRAEAAVAEFERQLQLVRLQRDGAAMHAVLAGQLAEAAARARLDPERHKQAEAALALLARVTSGTGDIPPAMESAKTTVATYLRSVTTLWDTHRAKADASLATLDDRLATAAALECVREFGQADLDELSQQRRALENRRRDYPDEIAIPTGAMVTAVDALCTRTAERARQDAIRRRFADQVASALVDIGYGASVVMGGDKGVVKGVNGSRTIVLTLTLGDQSTSLDASFEGFPRHQVERDATGNEFATCDEAEGTLEQLRKSLAEHDIATDPFQWDRRRPQPYKNREKRLQQRQQQNRQREMGDRP